MQLVGSAEIVRSLRIKSKYFLERIYLFRFLCWMKS